MNQEIYDRLNKLEKRMIQMQNAIGFIGGTMAAAIFMYVITRL